jgi:hypothetical protein
MAAATALSELLIASLEASKAPKVDADVLVMEAALALSTHMKIDYPGCHIHQNVNIRNYSDKGQVAQQLDATHALLQRMLVPTSGHAVRRRTAEPPDLCPNSFEC